MPSVIKALCLFSLGIQVQQSRASMDLTHYDGLFISRKHCQGLSKKSGCIAEEHLSHLWRSNSEQGDRELCGRWGWRGDLRRAM